MSIRPLTSVTDALVQLATLDAGTPDPPPQAPPGLEELAGHLIGWLKWGVLTAGMIALLVCAIMIIVGRRNRGGLAHEGVRGSLWVLGGLTLAALATVLVGTVAGSVPGVGTP
jgi:hypothetical protein